jgi:uncharacterized membrane protein YfcA
VEALSEFAPLVAMAMAATLASWIGAVAGTGGTTVLLPVLVFFLGVKDAIPVLTICNLTSNLSRSWFNRERIDLKVVAWFAAGGVPLVAVGAYFFTMATPTLLLRALGVFLLVVVAWRRLAPLAPRITSVRTFAPLGGVFGFLYGFTEGVGPLMAPFFLAYGMTKGVYIGTDALATFIVQAVKLSIFGSMDVLVGNIIVQGLVLAPFMVLGSWIGRHTVDRIAATTFTAIIDVVLVVSALSFLLA